MIYLYSAIAIVAIIGITWDKINERRENRKAKTR